MSNGYGMSPGQPAPQPVPGQSSGGPQGPGAVFPLSMTMARNTREMAKWMKFLGVCSMIGGAVYCLSIAGIVFGWFPLLIGYWQYKAAEDLQRFSESGEGHALESGLNNLRLYYTVMGIMMLVGMGMMVLVALIYLFMFLVMGMAIFGAAAAGG